LFDVDIKVAGNIAIHVYGHNEGLSDTKPYHYDKCSYYYEVYEVEKGVITGKLEHNRGDGLTVLVHKILGEVISQTGKDK